MENKENKQILRNKESKQTNVPPSSKFNEKQGRHAYNYETTKNFDRVTKMVQNAKICFQPENLSSVSKSNSTNCHRHAFKDSVNDKNEHLKTKNFSWLKTENDTQKEQNLRETQNFIYKY